MVDAVVVGAGAAGLSLAHRLTGAAGADVVLVTAPEGPLRPAERTWCWWEAGPGEYDEAVVAAFPRLRVRGRAGDVAERRPGALRYKMLRSGGFEALIRGRLAERAGFRAVTAAVSSVRDAPGGGAEVRGTAPDGRPVVLRARWAFDSRPPRHLPPARTTLLQHFRGWFVRAGRGAFEPGVAELMDFRTPQPPRGLSFGYLLPLGEREALVEYTEFSPAPLADAAYDRALRHYTRHVLGLADPHVTAVEQGVIPMTDGTFPRRAGRSVFRIGVAGGAARPATGYAFAAVQRQSRAIADAFRRGRPPVPPPPHSARSRGMDAVLLAALDAGRVSGPDVLTRLFHEVPTERLLRFLDGRTRWWEDAAVGLRMPVGPMLRTAAELPFRPRRNASGK
ncbi:lycopene cyclase family protein [Streptomyces sp. MP131-18]|uniref:lycopene cyclase family protein n=1 Tax=Streptomyces sp. MP131-18 TaxID=1857892 RepID=UPI0009D42171|nr:lycopene cyclase family protein [Streptomyces sp. MP131-18]ONK12413.1 lycopene cyclase family protein [Streptomyces sp. MP131-18]